MTDLIYKLAMDVAGWTEGGQEAKKILKSLEGDTAKTVDTLKKTFGDLKQVKSTFQELKNLWNVVLFNPTNSGARTQSEAMRQYGSEVTKNAKSTMASVRTTAGLFGGGSDGGGAASTGGNEVAKSVDKQNSSVNDLIGTVGKKAVIAWLAYKVAGEDAIEASKKHLTANSAMTKSLSEVWKAATGLTSTVTGELIGGLKASFNAALQFTTGFANIGEVVDYGAATITTWAKAATKGLDYAKKSAQDAALVFGTALAVFHGADAGKAAEFYEQGQALNQMAEATQKVIEKQEAMKARLDIVKGAFERAEGAAKTQTEVTKIGSITSLEALKQYEIELRKTVRDTDANTASSKEWQQQINQLVGAIAKQREAIKSGTAKGMVDTDMQSAKQAIEELIHGQTQLAIATYAAKGHTAEEINAYRGLLEQKQKLIQANEQQAATEQAIAAAKQAAEGRRENGQSRIDQMRDEIDLLTGQATKADLAMRDLFRQGFDEDQIAEVGRLTEELDKLRADKPKGSSDRQGSNEAVLEGSAKAAELVVRGTTGSGNKAERLQQQTLNKFDTLIGEVKNNKPPEPPPAANF